MAKRHFHFAVIGSSPLAMLLAGLLKSAHGRDVCLLSDRAATARLSRGFVLSAGIITRPETWRLLHSARTESLKLLAGIAGRRAMERIDLRIDAHHPDALRAVAHMRHVAAGYGIAMDRLDEAEGRGAWLMRDVAFQDRYTLRGMLDGWLAEMALPRFELPLADFKRNREGRASFTDGDERVKIAHLVLADDEAILAHADARDLASHFRVGRATSLLTEPAERLREPIALCADDGTITRQMRNRAIECLIPAPEGMALRLSGKRIGLTSSVRLAGLAEFNRLSTHDSAMAVGLLPKGQTSVIACAEPFPAFLAPALARYFADEASTEEQSYFLAHAPARHARRDIAEFGGTLPAKAVA